MLAQGRQSGNIPIYIDSTGPPLPPDPQCIPINKPDDQCWTTGACKCSWVKAIELKETMTDEEIKEKEEEDIERYKEALQVRPLFYLLLGVNLLLSKHCINI